MLIYDQVDVYLNIPCMFCVVLFIASVQSLVVLIMNALCFGKSNYATGRMMLANNHLLFFSRYFTSEIEK